MQILNFTLSLVVACSLCGRSEESVADVPVTGSARWVDPFIGTSGTAHCFPNATTPFGLVQAGPASGTQDWAYTGGYQFGDPKLYGFVQDGISGTGVCDLGDLLLQPLRGEGHPEDDYRYAKGKETATPGFYSVEYPEPGIATRVAASPHGAVYVFDGGGRGDLRLLVDQHWGTVNKGRLERHVRESETEFPTPFTMTGHNHNNMWVDRHWYFAMKFSLPVASRRLLPPRTKNEKGARYILTFENPENRPLRVALALSSTSRAAAERNLAAEVGDLDLARVRAAAERAWNGYLGRFEVEGDDARKRAFYTSVYHLCISPNNIADDGAKPDYGTLSLWDTFRAAHPMYTLLCPERVPDFVDSMMADYRLNGFMPIWTLWDKDNQCMIGTHSVPVAVDAFLKGLHPRADWNAVYAAIKDTLTRAHAKRVKEGWDLVDRYGYYPIDMLRGEGVSRLMECAYDDWCAALMAERLGKGEDAAFFRKRSGNWRNVFDPSIGLVRGRDSKGAWRTPFDPLELGHGAENDNDFTEGNSWQYTWHVMQDPEGLVAAFGGREPFCRQLEKLFTQETKVFGHDKHDVTGLIGQYAHGNEPSHHVIYFFQYAGRPDLVAKYVREVCDKFYLDRPDGLSGNDDCGQMSAWYLFSAMGFYPFNPCGGDYVLGAPQLPRVSLALPGGRRFTVVAKNLSAKNLYVKSVSLNGRPLVGFVLRHADIVAGGELVFEMTDAPSVPPACATPETSRLFARRVEPLGGVASYVLKTGLVADNQQSLYFVTKAMTDDGRFLLFQWSDNEFANKTVRRGKALVDFASDTVSKLPELDDARSFFVDTATDAVYAVGDAGFFLLDLKTRAKTKLCDIPRALLDLGEIRSYCTHLTLTRDRGRAFLESCVRDASGRPRYVQGLVNLRTGAYERWGETEFLCNHGQLCPADDDLALCAWEGHWEAPGREFRRTVGYWPRMWFLHRDGSRQFVRPYRADVQPTHETWAEDGRGHYWCAKPLGVWYQDRETGSQWNICPHYAEHANLSADNRFVVFDQKPKSFWRGSPQRVGFWNRDTGRRAWIYSTSAQLCGRNPESRLHPDGHPQFTGGGRYVVSTLDNADGHMDLVVTPVSNLVAATTGPAPLRDLFSSWPAGRDPVTIGTRLCERFLSQTPVEWTARHSRSAKTITYPTVCTWYGALEFAWSQPSMDRLGRLNNRLSRAYAPFHKEWASRVPPADHVDNSMFGALPLALYTCTGDRRLLDQGLAMAEAQWREPKPEDRVINGMFPYARQLELWKDGYTAQTRLWMDDMFMITILQLNAFRATGDRKFARRAAHEMVLYLDRLQKPDGLFDHGPGAPFVWARGAGWLAAGMAMLLKDLPEDDPDRTRILAGYRRMMSALLKHQRDDGLWGQLVDDPSIWTESSGSAMYAYAFIEGVGRGWLDVATFGPAARRAYLALLDRLDDNADLRDVCCGTNVGTSRDYYEKRPRITGDLHGQAPLLWCCAALSEYAEP